MSFNINNTLITKDQNIFNANRLQNLKISGNTPNDSNVLTWDSTSKLWEPSDISTQLPYNLVNITSADSTYNMDNETTRVLADTSAGSIDLNLPDPTLPENFNRNIFIERTGANSLQIFGFEGGNVQTEAAVGTVLLADNEMAVFTSSGVAWMLYAEIKTA